MERLNYKNYTSDLLKSIAEQLGVNVNMRFADTFKNQEAEEEPDADEIALDIIKRAGLKGKQDGCS